VEKAGRRPFPWHVARLRIGAIWQGLPRLPHPKSQGRMAIPSKPHPTIFSPAKTQHTVLPNVENSSKSWPGSRVRRARDGWACGWQGKCSALQTWTLKSLSERREGQRFMRPIDILASP
jgi:hypothetical protein